MRSCLLNIDLGEIDDEPEELYTLAHIANIACGGHAGDPASMAEALVRCGRHGTYAGAHPSFPDRPGFGRRRLTMSPDALRATVEEQCEALADAAAAAGVHLSFIKPHGALYHAADADAALARAVVTGAIEALGYEIAVIGPAGGALESCAAAAGVQYLREGFADRGTRPDGSLLPRDQPGALLTDPTAVHQRTLALVRGGEVQTICVHGDTPGAVSLARAARAALDTVATVLP